MRFLTLPGALFWLAAIVVLLIVEANTANMTTIWFAVGAIAAFVASQLNAGLVAQAAVFVAVSLAAVLLTRPLVQKWKAAPTAPTNADRNLGRRATVLTPVAPGRPGRVRLDGVDWAARPAGDFALQPGEQCVVTAMESTVLLVAPAPVAAHS